jgi:hypothetical protein
VSRKDYLSLFVSALQQGSPHHLPPDQLRHCLEVGTGTGVLSFILSTPPLVFFGISISCLVCGWKLEHDAIAQTHTGRTE